MKEETKEDLIARFITDLNDIHYKLWEIDIPSPTVPEYREHHKQVQEVMALVSEKLNNYVKDVN